jgi:acyl carrier protein
MNLVSWIISFGSYNSILEVKNGGNQTMHNSRDQIKFDVIRIIAEELDIAPDAIEEDTSLQNDLEADSLDTINIGLAIEETFSILLDDEAVQQFTEVKYIIDNLVNILT